jgi:hypothetical protein
MMNWDSGDPAREGGDRVDLRCCNARDARADAKAASVVLLSADGWLAISVSPE